ncbi:MAG TPA: PQQ-binding-like beta-propeller repeat protein [Candidatus Dormibacteraeota bacterium]|nr:PQQ-binding-like beta-propeller repeat protein [Candidatus Dormibacteraeota bacterium]
MYVGSLDSLYVLDASTGEVLKTLANGGFIDSSPAVVNGRVFLGSFDHKL